MNIKVLSYFERIYVAVCVILCKKESHILYLHITTHKKNQTNYVSKSNDIDLPGGGVGALKKTFYIFWGENHQRILFQIIRN